MTKNPQHIPAGYKLSPLGPIPEDWEVKRLGEVCTFHNGRAYSQKELLSSGKYRVLRVGNFFTNSSWYWSDMELENDKYANNGDLLYAWSASFGPRFWKGEKVIYHYHIWKIDSFKTISKEFLYSFLLYDAAMLSSTLQGGTMVHVTKENMEKRNIAIPSIIEQNKIVDLLSLWDTAIEKQTQLVEKLTLRKRGLMQQLLTGKKRLKGFSGEWGYHKIQDHFTEIRDKNDGKGHIPMTISAKVGLVSQTHKFDRIVAGNSLDKYTLLHKGDFAYNKGNSNLYEMGCIYRLKEESAVVPFVYICFRVVDDTCCEFYQQFFINHGLDKQLKQIITSGARGDGLLNVNSEDFMALKIPYPPIKEQQAIASILNNADKEIELANKKLARLQEEKKGLMQVLLTGKKRVVKNNK